MGKSQCWLCNWFHVYLWDHMCWFSGLFVYLIIGSHSHFFLFIIEFVTPKFVILKLNWRKDPKNFVPKFKGSLGCFFMLRSKYWYGEYMLWPTWLWFRKQNLPWTDPPPLTLKTHTRVGTRREQDFNSCLKTRMEAHTLLNPRIRMWWKIIIYFRMGMR